MQACMSRYMSPTKKNDNKQVKPTRFEMVLYKDRQRMSLPQIDRHLQMAEIAEQKAFNKFKEMKTYREWTMRIHRIKQRVEQEKQILKEKK